MLISTAEAARQLGLSARTLQRYAKDPKIAVTPAVTTPSGHYRWDMDKLRQQFKAFMREHG